MKKVLKAYDGFINSAPSLYSFKLRIIYYHLYNLYYIS